MLELTSWQSLCLGISMLLIAGGIFDCLSSKPTRDRARALEVANEHLRKELARWEAGAQARNG